MPGVKKTRTMRKAAMVIPWVREVMEVGEELTAEQIISRIKTNNTPPSSGKRPAKNLRNLPNSNSISYMLSNSGEYERAKNDGIILWRRVV